MRYVVAYDISDDYRRHQVAKFLEGWGKKEQKSVFECELSHEELRNVSARLKESLALSEDRCHIYRLCGECVPKRLVFGSEVELEWEETIVA